MSAKAKRFMNMGSLASGFSQRVAGHEQTAADAATAESRLMYTRWLGKRPLAPPRTGRPTTSGAFANYLQWQRDAQGGVKFELPGLESAAPYYLIQEIGTGQSATVLNPAGHVAVQSQRGRSIPMSLYWGDGVGTVATGPMSGKQRQTGSVGLQQLYPVSSLPSGTSKPMSRTGRIRKEIKGKHYIQAGGTEGFDVLRYELINDATQTFR